MNKKIKKYELIKDDTKTINNKTLYRIRALRDFNDVKKGDLGGYVESESNLSHDHNAWIYDNACSYENSHIGINAGIHNNSKVYGNAYIGDNAHVSGCAHICRNTFVYNDAFICEHENTI